MIPVFLLTWAAKAGVPEKYRKDAVAIAFVVLVIAAIVIGVKLHDRKVIRQHEQSAQLKQVTRERKADTNLQVQKGRDDAAAQQRQQEIENATRNIPDQAPSARQRAIACVELRREAKERRQPQPAC